jgi:cell division initiation protein
VRLTPEDIEHQVFKERFRGYDQGEVDRFLDRLAGRITELERERDLLADRVRALTGRAGDAGPEALLERTVLAAQRTADEAVAEARGLAEQAIEDARLEAEHIIEEARAQAAEIGAQAQAQAARVEAAVEEFRRFRAEYRERVEAVIADQLAMLDRAGEIPDLPDVIIGGSPDAASGAGGR